ncbi:MAG TPA: hypothetical protein VMF52_20835 [Steroidobacteraceae bacterium]|nr:hypothetical protein [Steroidobacteraceae bacterium]
MKANISSLVVAALLLATGSTQAAPPRVLEDAREVAPSMLTLPSTADGRLSIQGCSTCKRIDLAMARDVRFFVGPTEVTYSDLQRQLRTYPKAAVLVVSPRGQLVVTRIKMAAAVTQ